MDIDTDMFCKQVVQSGLITCLLSLIMVPSASSNPAIPRRHRLVGNLGDYLCASHAYLHRAQLLDMIYGTLRRWSNSAADKTATTPSTTTNPYYTIDTYFHIVSDTGPASPSSSNCVTDPVITKQFNKIALAYTNASIGYRYMDTTSTANNS
jgi:hypothetical protein